MSPMGRINTCTESGLLLSLGEIALKVFLCAGRSGECLIYET